MDNTTYTIIFDSNLYNALASNDTLEKTKKDFMYVLEKDNKAGYNTNRIKEGKKIRLEKNNKLVKMINYKQLLSL